MLSRTPPRPGPRRRVHPKGDKEMRVLRRAGVLAAGLALALGSVVVANPPAASAATCPDNNWHTADGRIAIGIGGTIRTGTSTACTAVGVLAPGHSVRLDCFKVVDTRVWSHVTDLSTGVRGWVVGDYANAPC